MTDGFPPIDSATWRKKVEAELKGSDFDRVLKPESIEGFSPEPLYAADRNAPQPTPGPGQSPYRRGHQESGATGVSWGITQRHSLADLDDLEASILEDQAGGATGTWLVFDRGARLGLDSDDSESIEHSGVEGCPICELSQLDQAIGSLDLVNGKLHLDMGANALCGAALFMAIAELRGIDTRKTKIRFDADPIASLARDGEIPGGLNNLIREAADLAKEVETRLPSGKTFQVSTEPWQEAGVSCAQEIAISLATALTYLRAMEEAGMNVESAAQQIAFRVPMGRDIFQSIAKVRALRSLWNVILESCGVNHPTPGELHAVPSRRTLTRFDPWINMLRTTTQTMAAICSGADEITSAPYDLMLGPTWWPSTMGDFVHHLPPQQNSFERSGFVSSTLGRRVARNTQIILGEESHLGQVADPAGGSYYVEALTDELSERCWQVLQDIESEGGMVSALRNGTLHSMAAERLRARQGRTRRRQDPITGVSEYANLEEERELEFGAKFTKSLSKSQEFVANHKKTRGPLSLKNLTNWAETIHAAMAGSTIGEMSQSMVNRGEIEAMEPLRRRSDASDFEELREFADHLATKNKRPRIYLATIGNRGEYSPRSTFITNFFAAGGIEVEIAQDGEKDHEEAWKKSSCHAVCICGSNGGYENEAGELAEKLSAALGENHPLFIAGRTDKLSCQMPTTVVPIYQGCDAIHILGGILYLSDSNMEATQS